MTAKAIKCLLVAFFLSPLFILCFYIQFSFDFNIQEVLWALKNSLLQGVLSAAISVGFGFYGAITLLSLPSLAKKILQKICLIPIFLPSLFIILISLSVVSPFPMGNLGVIFVLSLIHFGYVSSVLSTQIENQSSSLISISCIYNIPKWEFYQRVLIPPIKKNIGLLFVLVFINSITAFTVPLILGGGRGTNLEILIYEKVFIDMQWSMAFVLGLMQQVILAFVTYALTQQPITTNRLASWTIRFPAFYFNKIHFVWLAMYLFIFLFGYGKLAFSAFDIFYLADIFSVEFYQAIFQSLIFYFANTIFFMLLLFGVLYLHWMGSDVKFLNFFINSSMVLTGTSMYFFFPVGMDFLKVCFIFNIIYFVSLYKSTLEHFCSQIKSQMNVARIYNLNFFKFCTKIFFQQGRKIIFFVLSVLLIMTLSEFALIKVTGSEFKTLGVLMATYLSSYRIEGAFIISLVILFLWLLISALIGVVLGLHKKS